MASHGYNTRYQAQRRPSVEPSRRGRRSGPGFSGFRPLNPQEANGSFNGDGANPVQGIPAQISTINSVPNLGNPRNVVPPNFFMNLSQVHAQMGPAGAPRLHIPEVFSGLFNISAPPPSSCAGEALPRQTAGSPSHENGQMHSQPQSPVNPSAYPGYVHTEATVHPSPMNVGSLPTASNGSGNNNGTGMSVGSNDSSALQILLDEFRNFRVTMREEIPALVREEVEKATSATTRSSNLCRSKAGSTLSVQSNEMHDNRRVYHSSLKLKDLPKFNGDLVPVHPRKFKQEVEAFYRPYHTSDEIMLNEISQLLEGKARTWCNLFEDKFNTVEEFWKHFLEYFWGQQTQEKVMGQLLTPNSYRRGPMSMPTYFMNFFSKAKYLDDPLPESMLISTILKHFPPAMRRNLQPQRSNTLEKTLEQLQILEEDADIYFAPSQYMPQTTKTASGNRAGPKQNYAANEVQIDFSVPPPPADLANKDLNS